MNKRSILISSLLIVLIVCACMAAGCGLFTGDNCQHENTHWDTINEANCQHPGMKALVCDKCGHTIENQEFGQELLGQHQFEWVVDVPATCENEGFRREECKICREVRNSEPILRLAHEDKNGDCRCDLCSAPAHSLTLVPEVAPTCTKAGNAEHWTCDVCNLKFWDKAGTDQLWNDGIIEAIGHIPSNFTDTPPTCTSDGHWSVTCEVCQQIVEEGTNSKLPHTDENYDCICEVCHLACHETVKMQAQEALCMTAGNLEYWSCEKCRKLFSDKDATQNTTLQEVSLVALNHNYVEGICSRCALKQGTSGLLLEPIYKADDNTTIIAYAVAGIGEVTDTEIVIPASHNGLPVTTVNAQAFKETNVTKVEIQTSVTKIGQGTFAKCADLQSLVLPFVGQSAEESRTIASQFGWLFENEYFSNSVTVTQRLYHNVPYGSDYYDTTVRMPTALTSVTVTQNIIPVCGFYACTTIQEFTVGEKVTRIEGNAFYGCSGLRQFNFNATNCTASLFSWYPIFNRAGVLGITLKVGANVTKIPSELFDNNNSTNTAYLVKVEFAPDSVCESIGSRAFYACRNLTEINIPASVKSIGRHAFYWCDNLSRIDIYDIGAWLNIDITESGQSNLPYECYANPLYWGNNLYLNGELLTDLVIPSSVTQIKNYAFAGAKCLQTVTFENIGNIQSIGKYAFQFCTNINGVYLNAADVETAVVAWCKIPFSNQTSNPLSFAGHLYINGTLQTELTFVRQITEVGNYAFYGMKDLTRVHFSNVLQQIGDYAFYGCSALKQYDTIAYDNTEVDYYNRRIGNYAFYGCTLIGSNLNWAIIGDYAYFGCEELQYVYISQYTKSIGTGAFANCAITKFSVDTPNEYFNVIDGNLYTKDGLTLVYYASGNDATSFEIPDGVTRIGAYAFCGVDTLKTLIIPSSVGSIGTGAFKDCTSLEGVYVTDLNAWCKISFGNENSNPLVYAHNLYLNGETLSGNIELGEDVTVIPSYTFYNSDITGINIPASVVYIGAYSFGGCNQLQSIEFDAAGNWKVYKDNLIYTYTITQEGALIALTQTYVEEALTKA